MGAARILLQRALGERRFQYQDCLGERCRRHTSGRCKYSVLVEGTLNQLCKFPDWLIDHQDPQGPILSGRTTIRPDRPAASHAARQCILWCRRSARQSWQLFPADLAAAACANWTGHRWCVYDCLESIARGFCCGWQSYCKHPMGRVAWRYWANRLNDWRGVHGGMESTGTYPCPDWQFYWRRLA